MSLWNVNMNRWSGDNFGPIVPESVLVEHDGLLTFTFKDKSGSLMLAHLSDEDETTARYIVAPTTEMTIEWLKRGTVSMRGALNQAIVWIIDVRDGGIVSSWVGTLGDIPAGCLPLDDAMLHPSLKPILTLKVPGPDYRFGAVVTDAIRELIDRAEAAISGLVKHVAPNQKDEYGVEARNFVFNSIAISFQPKLLGDQTSFLPDDTVPRVEEMIIKGLKWVDDEKYPLPETDRVAILSAMRELSPKQGGPISSIEVTGRAVDSKSRQTSLTSDTRRRINTITRTPKINSVKLLGQVRELDAGQSDIDTPSFRLRNIRGGDIGKQEVVFNFARDEFWEDVYRHLNKPTWVRVSGELEPGTVRYNLDGLDEVDPSNG